LCEGLPRQKAAESLKIPESGSVIPREGVESLIEKWMGHTIGVQGVYFVIPRVGVESDSPIPITPFVKVIDLVIPREGVEREIRLAESQRQEK
jgi:hypothetical protein